MIFDVERYRYKSRKKKKRGRVILLITAGIIIVFAFVWWLRTGEHLKFLFKPAIQGDSLSELWNNRLFDEIITNCDETLNSKAMDVSSLMYRGFAFFYKAVSEVTLENKIHYLEEAIISLRRAKLNNVNQWEPEINYILGKAYYHKGKYYYDLTLAYLEQALSAGFDGEDIYDYLGLAYTQLELIEQGLEYFKLALNKDPTDLLLLTIGQNYYQLKRAPEAEEYLIRAINKTDDSAIERKSRFLLGQLYFEKKDYFKSEKEYQQILTINPRSADAHFYLGEIYQMMNDPVKARAEWRKTLIIDPSHYGAKLRYYK